MRTSRKLAITNIRTKILALFLDLKNNGKTMILASLRQHCVSFPLQTL